MAVEVRFNEYEAPVEVHDTLLLARTGVEYCHNYLVVTVACDLAASPGLTPGESALSLQLVGPLILQPTVPGTRHPHARHRNSRIQRQPWLSPSWRGGLRKEVPVQEEANCFHHSRSAQNSRLSRMKLSLPG